MNEPKIQTLDNYTLKIHYWFSELDNRPYYSHALFMGKKSLLVLPTCNKELSIKQVIGMYKAKELGR